MADFTLLCRDCRAEVALSQTHDGRCPSCTVKTLIGPELAEYRRLYAKYRNGWSNRKATEAALVRQVKRISAKVTRALAQGPGLELMNAELARIRSEVEGYQRVIPMRQGLLVPAHQPGDLVADVV